LGTRRREFRNEENERMLGPGARGRELGSEERLHNSKLYQVGPSSLEF